MINRYILTEEVEKEYIPIIESFINKLDDMSNSDIDIEDSESFQVDLSQTKLTPYTLSKLMEKLGYSEIDTETNGWQLDFWTNIRNNNAKSDLTEQLCIMGCGMTFELILANREFL